MENTEKQSSVDTIQHENTAWIDVQSPTAETLKQLEITYHLHPVHLQESMQKVQHNQVEREENYMFLVMHFPVYNRLADRIMLGQIGIFLGKNFVITVRNEECPSITKLYNHLRKEEHGIHLFKQGPACVLYKIINHLLEELSYMTDDVVSELDELEEAVFDNNASDAQRIGKARQKIVRLMRLIGPKRVILQDLAEQIGSFAGHDMVKRYSSNAKLANKLWEIIEEAKETVEIYKDADFTISTEKTNETLAVLTIIFTLTIPITVVGTLYGMNVPLPGGIEVGAWTFLGRYTTLIVLFAASIVFALCMYFYFRIKKWF